MKPVQRDLNFLKQSKIHLKDFLEKDNVTTQIMQSKNCLLYTSDAADDP